MRKGADVFGNRIEISNREKAHQESTDRKMILSAHLPPAKGKIEQFLDVFARVPASAPFVAPNQVALEQILAQRSASSG